MLLLHSLLFLAICAAATSDLEFDITDTVPEMAETMINSRGLADKRAAPLLPFNDANMMVLTDVHSWISGHAKHEAQLDADYGDVLSFYQQIEKHVARNQNTQQQQQDLYLVNNGDMVHGSVLGVDPPVLLLPIIQKMPFDLINLGNHDIESSDTVQYLNQPGGFVDWFGPALVTSNILVNATGQPMGNRFRYLRGDALTILAFGFLYNMEPYEYSSLLTVERVQEVVQADWFLNELKRTDEYDVIVVMAHMHFVDPLVGIILRTIRRVAGTTVPVQIIAGHTHIRAAGKIEKLAETFQAGRFLDTVGWASFDKGGGFGTEFITAGTKEFKTILNNDDFTTNDGQDLKEFIAGAQQQAGGDEVIGCAPRLYRANGYLNETDSLLRLHMEEVMPITFLKDHDDGANNVLMHRIHDFIDHDLYPGKITLNDVYGMMPRDSTITKIAHSLRGDKVERLTGHLRTKHTFLNGTAYTYAYMSKDGLTLIPDGSYELFSLTTHVTPPVRDFMTGMRVQHQLDELVPTLTVRGLWIDFIKSEWPAYGGECNITYDPAENTVENTGAVFHQGPVDLGESKEEIKAVQEEEEEEEKQEEKKKQTATGLVVALSIGLVLVVGLLAHRWKSGRRRRRNVQMVRLGTGSLQSYRDNIAPVGIAGHLSADGEEENGSNGFIAECYEDVCLEGDLV